MLKGELCLEANKNTIISKGIIMLKKKKTVLLSIKSFITQQVFIQSFKLDMFWKAEKTEKHI